MSSSTITFSNPPCGGQDLLNQIAGMLSTSNVYSVPQTFAGITDSSTLAVAGLSSLSGGVAVVGSVTLPAGSIVQSAVANGYIDLSSAQTIAGAKTFSVSPSFPAGISTAGEVDSGTLTVQGVASLSGGLVLPSCVSVPTFVAGALSIDLGVVSYLTLAYTMTAAVTSLNIVGGRAGGIYWLLLTGAPTAQVWNKNMGANVVSSLNGNTSVAGGSKWAVKINFDGTAYMLDFTSFT